MTHYVQLDLDTALKERQPKLKDGWHGNCFVVDGKAYGLEVKQVAKGEWNVRNVIVQEQEVKE